VQLGNIIGKDKDQQSAAKKVYGTNPKWISNIRAFGEMVIIARHSVKKIRSKLADRGNTVMFVLYLDIHELIVYQFMNIATSKTMFSRDDLWLHKTYSQHMGISQIGFITGEVEAEDMDETEVCDLEGELHVGPSPAITEDEHIEQLIDVPEVTLNPAIVAPYPTSTRQLKSSVLPAPKKMSREFRSL
jgi:hypothetical protein